MFYKHKQSSEKKYNALSIKIVAAIVLVGFSVLFFNDGRKLTVGDFIPIKVDTALAKGNFTVEATKADEYAVESDTGFVITSKQDVSLDQIKDAVRIEPHVLVTVVEKEKNVFAVLPEEGLDASSVYNVKIATTNISTDGKQGEHIISWAFQVKDEFKILKTLPADMSYKVPVTSGIEIEFSAYGVKHMKEHFTITPHIEGVFKNYGKTVAFIPNQDLEYEKIYTITIDKSLEAKGYGPIHEDFEFRFETTPDPSTLRKNELYKKNRPRILFKERLLEVIPGKTAALPLTVRGAKTVFDTQQQVAVYQFNSFEDFEHEIKRITQLPQWSYSAKDARVLNKKNTKLLHEYTLTPAGESSASYTQYLVLPDTLDYGFYAVTMKQANFSESESGNEKFAFVQSSNISVFNTITETDTLFWTNSMDTEDPIVGAALRFGDKEIGKTNKSGVVTVNTSKFFPYTERGLEKKDATKYVNISKGGDQLLVKLGYKKYNDTRGQKKYEHWQHLTTDRPIYHQTDNVKFWGYMQNRQTGNSPEKVVVSVREGIVGKGRYSYFFKRRLGEDVVRAVVDVDKNGFYEGELSLDDVTAAYNYSVVVKTLDNEILDTQNIQVKDFVKPAYTINIKPRKKLYMYGEDTEVVFDVEAKFFEGTPAGNLDLAYNNYALGSGNVTTNSEGRAVISLAIPTNSCSQVRCQNSKYFALTVRPKIEDFADISSTASINIFYANVRLDGSFTRIEKDKSESVVSTTVYYNTDENGFYVEQEDVDPKPAAGIAVEGVIIETEYKRIEAGEYYDVIEKVKRKIYKTKRIEKEFKKFQGITGQNGEFILHLDTNPERSYKAHVALKDNEGRGYVATKYVYTTYNFLRHTGGSDFYTIKSEGWEKDKNIRYTLGNQVNLEMLKNQEEIDTDEGGFLFYQLQKGLKRYDVSEDAKTSFVFTKDHLPAVAVVGVLFDGERYHISDNGFVRNNVKFDIESQEVVVELHSDKKEHAPGEEATIHVRVHDKHNRPVAAAVNLALVDEAVFALSYQNVNPLSALYTELPVGQLSFFSSHKYASTVSADLDAGAEKGCFLAGTKILMADGTTTPIEEIKVGHEVLTFQDQVNKVLVKNTVTGLQEHVVGKYLIINHDISVTPEHLIFVNGRFKEAGDIAVGDILRGQDGQSITVESVEVVNEVVTVYNFETNPNHTYIADGIYVHNDKGGGSQSSRSNFQDTAFFGTIQTNRYGKGQITFVLPDNITSWRVTAQAISDDLKAGKGAIQMPVSLPVFVTTEYAKEYVVGDKPFARGVVFGRDLQVGSAIHATLASESLDIHESVAGKAFHPFYLPLAKEGLVLGDHDMDIRIKTGNHEDGIKRNIRVIGSRSEFTEEKVVTPHERKGSVLSVETKRDIDLFILDKDTGSMYGELAYLGCPCSGRIDRQFVWEITQKKKHEYFGGTYTTKDKSFAEYQDRQGGIKLLPYDSVSLDLSAQVAPFASEYFSTRGLKRYFYNYLGKSSVSSDELAMVHFGLAALGEPVLVSLRSFVDSEEFTPKGMLYIGLAAAELGDHGLALEMFEGVVKDYGETREGISRILRKGDRHKETHTLTGLAAMLSAAVGDEQKAQEFRKYLRKNTSDQQLTLLEQLYSVNKSLALHTPKPYSVTVQIHGEERVYTGEKGHIEKVTVSKDVYNTISVKNISDNATIIAQYQKAGKVQRSSSGLRVERKYFIDGVQTNTFMEGDIVEVRVFPQFPRLFDSATSYTFTDFLPSGLDYIERPYKYGKQYRCSLYSLNQEGQVARFSLRGGRSSVCDSGFYRYYARVTHPGVFVVESPVIQSEVDPNLRSQENSTEAITILEG